MTAKMGLGAKALVVSWVVGALSLVSHADSGTWANVVSGGLWSATENWVGGVVADGSGASANFGSLDILTNNTVYLDAPHTLTGLVFGDTDTSTAAGWTLDNNGSATNVLTLAGVSPTIAVNAMGSGKGATVSAEIAGTAGLIKAGAGTLTLMGTNTYTGGTVVNGGTLAAALPSSLSGAVALSNNSQLTLPLVGSEVSLSGKPTNASGYPENAWQSFDGNASGSRWWSGNYSLPAWIYVDMGANYTLGRVAIAWERANGRDYTIRMATQAQFDASSNPATWPIAATVYNDQNWSNDGSIWTTITLNSPTTGRYLGLYCTGSNWEPAQVNLMISIWEVRAFQAADYAIASLTGTAGTSVELGGNRLTVGDANSTVFGGSISDGNLVKTGSGTLTLAGGNQYGATTVNSGTLRLSPYTMYNGVVAYYQFNNSSNLGADSSGCDNNLVTASGTPLYSANGKFGGALYLDGSSTMNKGGAFPAGVPTGNSPYTVSAWIKPVYPCAESDFRGGWVGWGNYDVSQANNCRLASPTYLWIYWWGNDFGGGITSGTFYDGWHSVVVTWDCTTEIIYVDGAEVSRRVPSVLPNVGAANFVVGKTIGDSNFIGWVDDLLIANRAFSPPEIANVLSETMPVMPTQSPVQVAAGATLDLNGASQSVGALSGFGTVTNGSATALTFTVGNGGLGDVFAGNIKDGAGAVTLAKAGAGTQILSGTNTYSGATLISGGTLKLGQRPPDAVAYYQFNDPNSLGSDSSGYGNTLDPSAGENLPQYSASGKFGGAVYFNGFSSMDMASGQFPVGVPTGAAPYTVSAYIKIDPSSFKSGGWIGYGWPDFGQCNNYRLLDSYNAVWNYWWGNDFGATLPSGSFTDDWHSVVGTWDGSVEKLYLDGACLTTRYPSGLNIQPRLFLLGKTVVNEFMTGWVDDVMFANRAYTAEEIATLLNEGYHYPVLPQTTPVQIASGAKLDLNGVSQAIGSLADSAAGGGGTVTNSAGSTPVTLTVNLTSGSSAFSGVIGDGGAASAVSLVKSGAGTLTLSGANAYCGATTVGGGTLRLGANNALPDASQVNLAGGTLDLNGATDTAGALNVSADSTLALGSGSGLLNFSGDSTGLTWSGRLNLTGTLAKVGPTCLRFYPNGLTIPQLRRIKINGSPVGLDENLYLIKRFNGTLLSIK